MKLFKKKSEKTAVKATITKLDKNQLETVVGGAANPGEPIGGIVVKGGRLETVVGGAANPGEPIGGIVVKGGRPY